MRWIFEGCDRADSLVVNPHKWLFTPLDLSILYSPRIKILKQAFSLIPDYLKTTDAARNYMDYGVPLGRRFRALKLWMVIRSFGRRGLQARIREHLRLAGLLAGWIDADSDFERAARSSSAPSASGQSRRPVRKPTRSIRSWSTRCTTLASSSCQRLA